MPASFSPSTNTAVGYPISTTSFSSCRPSQAAITTRSSNKRIVCTDVGRRPSRGKLDSYRSSRFRTMKVRTQNEVSHCKFIYRILSFSVGLTSSLERICCIKGLPLESSPGDTRVDMRLMWRGDVSSTKCQSLRRCFNRWLGVRSRSGNKHQPRNAGPWPKPLNGCLDGPQSSDAPPEAYSARTW
jgi:hypothetical protein